MVTLSRIYNWESLKFINTSKLFTISSELKFIIFQHICLHTSQEKLKVEKIAAYLRALA